MRLWLIGYHVPLRLRRHQVFSRLLLQPVDFFDAEEVGALTSRLGSDCQAVARALTTNFNVAFRNGLQCIGEPLDGMALAARSQKRFMSHGLSTGIQMRCS